MNIVLPDDGASRLPVGFTSTSVHLPEAPAGTRSFVGSQPAGNPQAARSVGGMARSMIGKVFS